MADENKDVQENIKEKEAEKNIEQKNQPEAKNELGKESELKEQMLRIAAEFDNYKKRTKREMEMAERIGAIGAIKAILPSIDEFELAIASSSKAEMKDSNIIKGFEMVYANIIGALKGMGLSAVLTQGKLDPMRHETLMVISSDKPYGTIIDVVKKGYEYHGILVRPAAVVISSGKSEQQDGMGEKSDTKSKAQGGIGIDGQEKN